MVDCIAGASTTPAENTDENVCNLWESKGTAVFLFASELQKTFMTPTLIIWGHSRGGVNACKPSYTKVLTLASQTAI